MSGPYRIKWGIFGGPTWDEESTEDHLEDAVRVMHANGGTIFDSKGYQLTREDIEQEINRQGRPYLKPAEEIVGTLFYGLSGKIGERLEIQERDGRRIGAWTVESAVKAVERALEGSGL